MTDYEGNFIFRLSAVRNTLSVTTEKFDNVN